MGANPISTNAPSSRDRVRKHRAEMRARGMKLVQIWVPDVDRPGFAEECRLQSLLTRAQPDEKETIAWIEKAQDYSEWE